MDDDNTIPTPTLPPLELPSRLYDRYNDHLQKAIMLLQTALMPYDMPQAVVDATSEQITALIALSKRLNEVDDA